MKDDTAFPLTAQIIEAFSMFFAHPALFAGFAGVSFLPYAAVIFSSRLHEAILFLIQMTYLITFPACMGAAAKAVSDIQKQGYASFLNCLRTGFSKTGSFLVLIPIFFLIGLLAVFVVSLLATIIVWASQISPFAGLIVSNIVFSVIFAVYAVTVPVIVLEKTSVTESLKRSAALTSGRVVKIFLFFMIFVFTAEVTFYFFFLMDGGSSLSDQIASVVDVVFDSFSFKLPALAILLSSILFVICGVFYKTCYKLTESKKVEDLADIF